MSESESESEAEVELVGKETEKLWHILDDDKIPATARLSVCYTIQRETLVQLLEHNPAQFSFILGQFQIGVDELIQQVKDRTSKSEPL